MAAKRKKKKSKSGGTRWGDEETPDAVSEGQSKRLRTRTYHRTQEGEDRQKRVAERRLRLRHEQKKSALLSTSNRVETVKKRKKPRSRSKLLRKPLPRRSSFDFGPAAAISQIDEGVKDFASPGDDQYAELLSTLRGSGVGRNNSGMGRAIAVRKLEEFGDQGEYDDSNEEGGESDNSAAEGEETSQDSLDEGEGSAMEAYENGEGGGSEDENDASEPESVESDDDRDPFIRYFGTREGKGAGEETMQQPDRVKFREVGEHCSLMVSTSSISGNVPLDFEVGGARPKKKDKMTFKKKSLFLHSKARTALLDRWMDLNGGIACTDSQSVIFESLLEYKDVVHFGVSHEVDAPDLRRALAFHALNHCMKSARRLSKHDARIKAAAKDGRDVEGYWVMDQGFTRPKVLILTPFRHTARAFVSAMVELSSGPDKVKVTLLPRFEEEYGLDPSASEELPEKQKLALETKPADWHCLLGEDKNCDDDFKLGMSIGASGRVKLYTEFYKSDVIIASPLGLKLASGEENYDFLSSVEVVYFDAADTFLMQNWAHVDEVAKSLNLIPKRDHGTDFSRVKEVFVNGLGSRVRQSVVLSSIEDPRVNALVSPLCRSLRGAIKFTPASPRPSIADVAIKVPHMFHFVGGDTPQRVDEERFRFFIETLLPALERETHTLIFIPSYFDFVRIRNALQRKEVNGAWISEYSRSTEISRGRARFFHGIKSILLYTGRAHFFQRFRIRGARRIFFYSVPEYPKFYPEIVNAMEAHADHQAKVVTLFSRYEKFALGRILGESRIKTMLDGSRTSGVFMFD